MKRLVILIAVIALFAGPASAEQYVLWARLKMVDGTFVRWVPGATPTPDLDTCAVGGAMVIKRYAEIAKTKLDQGGDPGQISMYDEYRCLPPGQQP